MQRLNLSSALVYKFTLTASKEALQQRIQTAINNGERTIDALQPSIARLPLYNSMDTTHIDVSTISQTKAAQLIVNYLS